MIIYYIYISILSFLCIIDPYIKDRRSQTFIFDIILIGLIFFAGFRGSGPDWHVYNEMFFQIIHDTGNGSRDFGFNNLCKLYSYIIPHPIFIFFSIAATSIILNGISIHRFTTFFCTAILLYFVHGFALKEMIQIRVGLSSAFCLFSLFYLYKEKLRLFFLFFFIAVTIHLTSIVFLLAYLGWKYLNKTKILYCVIISLLIGTFSPLGSVLKTITGIDGRLDDYIAYGNVGYAQQLGIWTNLNTVKCIIVFCCMYYYYDRLARNNKYFEILFKCYVMGLCWLICFNDFAIIGARMSNTLLSTEPILLTYPYTLFKQSSKMVYTIVLICLALMIFKANIAPDKITPYTFYFSNYI